MLRTFFDLCRVGLHNIALSSELITRARYCRVCMGPVYIVYITATSRRPDHRAGEGEEVNDEKNDADPSTAVSLSAGCLCVV